MPKIKHDRGGDFEAHLARLQNAPAAYTLESYVESYGALGTATRDQDPRIRRRARVLAMIIILPVLITVLIIFGSLIG